MEELLRELIEFVKQASPMVWESLVKQVYVQAFQHGVWAVLFLIISVVSCILAVRLTRKWIAIHQNMDNQESEYYRYHEVPIELIYGSIFSWLALVLFVPLFIGELLASSSRLINPDFYAIQLILSQLR